MLATVLGSFRISGAGYMGFLTAMPTITGFASSNTSFSSGPIRGFGTFTSSGTSVTYAYTPTQISFSSNGNSWTSPVALPAEVNDVVIVNTGANSANLIAVGSGGNIISGNVGNLTNLINGQNSGAALQVTSVGDTSANLQNVVVNSANLAAPIVISYPTVVYTIPNVSSAGVVTPTVRSAPTVVGPNRPIVTTGTYANGSYWYVYGADTVTGNTQPVIVQTPDPTTNPDGVSWQQRYIPDNTFEPAGATVAPDTNQLILTGTDSVTDNLEIYASNVGNAGFTSLSVDSTNTDTPLPNDAVINSISSVGNCVSAVAISGGISYFLKTLLNPYGSAVTAVANFIVDTVLPTPSVSSACLGTGSGGAVLAGSQSGSVYIQDSFTPDFYDCNGDGWLVRNTTNFGYTLYSLSTATAEAKITADLGAGWESLSWEDLACISQSTLATLWTNLNNNNNTPFIKYNGSYNLGGYVGFASYFPGGVPSFWGVYASYYTTFVLGRWYVDSPVLAKKRVSTGTIATGGTVTTYTSNNKAYRVHTFTANGTFTVTQASTNFTTFDLLIVGGGGAGGSPAGFGGGGGAGGVVYLPSQSIAVGSYSIVVGQGGTAYSSFTGGDGTESGFTFNSESRTVYAAGGGGGGLGGLGSVPATGRLGGSGGGAGAASTSITTAGGTGTSGQGYDGGNGAYYAGGGGGAGGPGSSGSGSVSSTVGAAGPGIFNSITGSNVEYGRGGQSDSPYVTMLSGSGGGGSANGYRGIVIVRYRTS